VGPQALDEVGQGRLAERGTARTVGDEPAQAVPEQLPALAVRQLRGPARRQDLGHRRAGYGHEAPLHEQALGRLRYPDPRFERAQEQAGHPCVALEAGHLDRLGAAVADLGRQPREVPQLHLGVAEAGQHVADVPHERGMRPHHEDIGRPEAVAVVEQQPGDAVQGDRGLARTRAALDHQHLLHRCPDQLELGGLDGGDDVAQLARTAAGQLGQQVPVHRLGDLREDDLGEVLDRVAHTLERALAYQPSGVRVAGLEVPGRGRRLPVDHQHLGAVVADDVPPDVQRRARLVVDPAEGDRLARAADRSPGRLGVVPEVGRGALMRGRAGQPVEPSELTGAALRRGVEVGLLLGELGLVLLPAGHRPPPTDRGRSGGVGLTAGTADDNPPEYIQCPLGLVAAHRRRTLRDVGGQRLPDHVRAPYPVQVGQAVQLLHQDHRQPDARQRHRDLRAPPSRRLGRRGHRRERGRDVIGTVEPADDLVLRHPLEVRGRHPTRLLHSSSSGPAKARTRKIR
jgi:hypothetical protein